MTIRVCITMGQFPMGLDQFSRGVFTGVGETPVDALHDAAIKAQEYYGERPTKVAQWEAACSLRASTTYEPDAAIGNAFKGEEAYGCRLWIHERHKEAT